MLGAELGGTIYTAVTKINAVAFVLQDAATICLGIGANS